MILNNICICYKTLPLNKCYNNTITQQEECSLPEVRCGTGCIGGRV